MLCPIPFPYKSFFDLKKLRRYVICQKLTATRMKMEKMLNHWIRELVVSAMQPRSQQLRLIPPTASLLPLTHRSSAAAPLPEA
jgi:hypothetical protein